jgi:hypothetical protein
MKRASAPPRLQIRSGPLTRRRVLLALAIGAVGGCAVPRRGSAWSEEEAAAGVALSYRQGRACRPEGDRHRDLVAAARAELAAHGMSAAEQAAFLAALACPICGCALGG